MNKVEACTFSTPIGTMAIAWSGDRINGTFLPEANEKKLLSSVRLRLGQPTLIWTSKAPLFVENLATRIRLHLSGSPQRFDTQDLALPERGAFTRKVYECSQHIPSGQVMTYKELAEAAGSPKAFRAVGHAMAKNRFPILIPCHRVVSSGKSKGGFSAHGGLATKTKILRIEALESNS